MGYGNSCGLVRRFLWLVLVQVAAADWVTEMKLALEVYALKKAGGLDPAVVCQGLGPRSGTCDCWSPTGAPQDGAGCNIPYNCLLYGAAPTGDLQYASQPSADDWHAVLQKWGVPPDMFPMFNAALLVESAIFQTFDYTIHGQSLPMNTSTARALSQSGRERHPGGRRRHPPPPPPPPPVTASAIVHVGTARKQNGTTFLGHVYGTVTSDVVQLFIGHKIKPDFFHHTRCRMFARTINTPELARVVAGVTSLGFKAAASKVTPTNASVVV